MSHYTQLAKQAVENFIENGEIIPCPENIPEEMIDQKAGVFVTIEKEGSLRACIGTYLPARKNIAEEVIHNAIAAASEDYRFGPVKAEELPLLSYEVSVLSAPEKISTKNDINPKKYGILIRTVEPPFKSALLLPDLEGIDTIGQQIDIACQKGGITPEEGILIYRFTVEKYK